MSHKKAITKAYIVELCDKIKNGEKPGKEDDAFVSRKMFIREMMPHVKAFLAEGYSYKEIAVFLDHVSGDDLKKAVADDAENTKPVENVNTLIDETKKTTKFNAAPKTGEKEDIRVPCKGCSGRKVKPTK